MAEPESGSNRRKEMSMEVRLLLAFVLMGLVIFLTPYFIKTTPPAQKTAQTPPRRAAAQPGAGPAGGRGDGGAAAAAAPRVPGWPATAAATAAALRDQYQPVPRGLQQPGRHGAKLAAQEVQRQRRQAAGAGQHRRRPESVSVFPYFPAQQPTSNVNLEYFEQTPDAGRPGRRRSTYSDGHTAVRKVFRFRKDSYLAQVTARPRWTGKPLPNEIEWRGGFGDLTVSNAPAGRPRFISTWPKTS